MCVGIRRGVGKGGEDGGAAMAAQDTSINSTNAEFGGTATGGEAEGGPVVGVGNNKKVSQ